MGLFRKLKLGKTDRLKQGKLHVIKDASWDYTDEPKMAYSVGEPSWEESKSDEPKMVYSIGEPSWEETKSDEPKMVYSIGEPSMWDEPVKPQKKGLFRRRKVEPEEPKMVYSIGEPSWEESKSDEPKMVYSIGEPSMFDEPVKPAKRGLFRRKKVEPEEPVTLYSVAAEDPFERESRAAKAARAHAVRSSNELEDMFKDEPALGRTANGISGWKK